MVDKFESSEKRWTYGFNCTMEHRYRLEQPASREQIVAIIRQRAERNRERGGAPVGNPGDREVEARIDRRNAAIERRRFQAVRNMFLSFF